MQIEAFDYSASGCFAQRPIMRRTCESADHNGLAIPSVSKKSHRMPLCWSVMTSSSTGAVRAHHQGSALMASSIDQDSTNG